MEAEHTGRTLQVPEIPAYTGTFPAGADGAPPTLWEVTPAETAAIPFQAEAETQAHARPNIQGQPLRGRATQEAIQTTTHEPTS